MSRIKTRKRKIEERSITNAIQKSTPTLDTNDIIKSFEFYNRHQRKEGEPVLTEEQYWKKMIKERDRS